MVRLLVVEPGYCPYIAIFDTVPQAVSEVITGKSKVLLPFGTGKIGLVCSMYQDGLRFNRVIGEDGDLMYGRFLICGMNGDKLIGLSKEQADRYCRLYFQPQSLEMKDGDFPVAKVRPKDERFGERPKFWER
ncbi:MAG: hypothetical protein IJ412_10090 [Oscillospiraceae bacterium]|nr:hypothetical protein [Oscillospiraceae bacterium]